MSCLYNVIVKIFTVKNSRARKCKTINYSKFEKWYDLAVAHRQANLIVIHGVGKGKLKDEIHDILKTKRDVKSFINQYDGRFGYGATEIFFGF